MFGIIDEVCVPFNIAGDELLGAELRAGYARSHSKSEKVQQHAVGDVSLASSLIACTIAPSAEAKASGLWPA